MATLKVKIQEDIVLGNQDYGSKRTLEISSINEIMKRVVTCAASQTTTIAVFNSNAYGAAGAVDIEDSKYIRVTNLDSSNSVNVAMVGASDNAQFVVPAGSSLMFGTPDDFMLGEADTSPAFSSFEDLASIIVDSGSNAVDVELFIASV